ADYWKSQPRKFCHLIIVFVLQSIEFHERGKNHKENVAAKISEIKKKSIEKAKQEKRMCKQFAEENKEVKQEEEVKATAAEPEKVEEKATPAPTQPKRRRAANPYGAWEKIKQEKDP
uniref:WW domain binding protein 4 n=1 Tax=Oryzias melastigma TaxID=30732 RepID=A0A3B3B6B8_ORYME